MKTIHKFSIPLYEAGMIGKVLTMRIPRYSKILYAREQGDAVAIWYETDTSYRSVSDGSMSIQPPVDVDVVLFMTGEDCSSVIPKGEWLLWQNIGMAFFKDGAFVLHVYCKSQTAVYIKNNDFIGND